MRRSSGAAKSEHGEGVRFGIGRTVVDESRCRGWRRLLSPCGVPPFAYPFPIGSRVVGLLRLGARNDGRWGPGAVVGTGSGRAVRG